MYHHVYLKEERCGKSDLAAKHVIVLYCPFRFGGLGGFLFLLLQHVAMKRWYQENVPFS